MTAVLNIHTSGKTFGIICSIRSPPSVNRQTRGHEGKGELNFLAGEGGTRHPTEWGLKILGMRGKELVSSLSAKPYVYKQPPYV